MKTNFFYHLIALFVVAVWGVTFINSKVLLLHGLAPHEIFELRFLLAYICIWFISPKRLWADNLKDEILLMFLGLMGGSLYFLAENTAVGISYVNNVSFILCTAPLITTLLSISLRMVKITPYLIGGSLVALIGVAMVIYNGSFILQLNPLGDMLALLSALSWAIYSLIIKNLSHYDSVFVTRKVFFYGLITMIPYFLVSPWEFPIHALADTVVWSNLLFLGVIASFACFVLWNLALKKIGVLSTSNYIYLNPVTTMIASAIFLDEPVTWVAYVGCFLILAGVYLSNQYIVYRK